MSSKFRLPIAQRRPALGAVRLALALMVLISHGFVTWYGYNPGIIAVISFFAISGYAMGAVLTTTFPTTGHVRAFYVDRLLRIFPQYLFYMLIAAGLFYAGLIVAPDFLGSMDPLRAALNVPIIPLGIPRVTQFDMTSSSFIPQAWSLALELSFYLVVPPIILLATRWQVRVLAALSCAVALAAGLGVINGHDFGYATLPGTLFIFLIGTELRLQRDPWLLAALVGFGAVLLVIAYIDKNDPGHIAHDVALGVLVATVLLAIATRIPGNRFDEFLGYLSYGVYLNHLLIIWLVRTHTEVGQYATFSGRLLAWVAALSLLAAAVSYYLVERPAERLRKSMRSAPR